MAGQTATRSDITAISSATACQVTTDQVHGLSTDDLVRLTDLNGMIPTARGMNAINNGRWKVTVETTKIFTLKDPITDEDVDSTSFTPYVSGGYCNLITTLFEYEA